MALFYITGVSGSGKSSIRQELQERGYEAHDTDEDDITAWRNRTTKEPAGKYIRSTEWLDEHEWVMPADRVRSLAKLAMEKTIFLCEVTSNQSEFFELFEKVFCLEIDQEILKHRLDTRTTNDFTARRTSSSASIIFNV